MKWQPPQDFQDCAKERQERLEWIHSLLKHAVSTDDLVPVEGGRVLRPLLPTEAATLQQTRCRGRDWMKVRLLLAAADSEADQSSILEDRVSDCRFDAVVILMLDCPSETVNTEWDRLSAGLHSCLLVSNCVISLKARVHGNSWITDTYVGPGAVALGCGRISASASSNVGQLTIDVGPESGGGRALQVFPESTMVDVCKQLKGSKATSELNNTSSWSMNVIDAGAVVRDTSTICNVYLYNKASIEGAASVSNAVLFPSASIQTNSTAESVLLQWKACIQDSSSVSNSLLMECAVSGPHSICASSILGPDVHVSAGEVHASLLGPNTNAHHQSLLISVLWPTGRGNVGYGANVGSNHTGRLPDQECVAGEGLFWGLGCLVKFPVNLDASPYSIVAAGTQLAPQRVALPFSLIVPVSGINQIVPGWVLKHSPYTLARNQAKYANRRKAVRHAGYTGWKIVRAETVDLCVAARNALRRAEVGSEDTAIVPLEQAGTCQLTEKGRRVGIEAYTECIQRFALEGLMAFLQDRIQKGELLEEESLAQEFSNEGERPSYVSRGCDWSPFPWECDEADLWRYQRSLLLEEFPRESDFLVWIQGLLKPMVDLATTYFVNVRKSKERDGARGIATIPGYQDAHVLSDNDPVVEEVRKDARRVVQSVVKIKEAIDKASSRSTPDPPGLVKD